MSNAYVSRQEEVANDLQIADHEKIQRDVDFAWSAAYRQSGKVLCVGTRDGYDMELFTTRGFHATGIDIGVEAMRRLSDKGMRARAGDVHHLGDVFGEERFDIIFARHVIEHCHSYEVALKEMVKHLSPGGHICISCPKGFNENPHHYAFFRDTLELGGILERFGLKVVAQREINDPNPIEDELLIVAKLETHKLAMISLLSPCNLACPYCYSNRGGENKLTLSVWKEFMRQHDCKWFANLCGMGETFMAKDIGAICREFTKNRNTLIISTNLSVPQTDDILESDLDYVVLLFSLHWEELERKNLLEPTLKRAARLVEYGCAVSPIMVLTPQIVPRIPEITARVMGECGLRVGGKVLRNSGAHVLMTGTARDVCDEHLFMGWYDAELRRDDVKGKRCNAGQGTIWVNHDGVVRGCAPMNRVLGSVNNFTMQDVGVCTVNQCACSLPFMMGSIPEFMPPADEYTVYNNGVSQSLKARLSIEVS